MRQTQLLQLLLLLACSLLAATAGGSVPPSAPRPLCEPGVPPPPNRFNSTTRLRQLRHRLGLNSSTFYLQTDRDRFLASPQPGEQFRTWLSGFAGSAGSVLVSSDSSMVFTDSRYSLQADQELLCDWLLYDSLSFADWLAAASRQRPLTLLLDAAQISAGQYRQLSANTRLQLVPLHTNPIDQLWTQDRPSPAEVQVYPLGRNYTGQTWAAKVDRTRQWMSQQSMPYLAVTALEDTAYLLNLRATVVQYKPYFASLVLLSQSQLHVFVDNARELLTSETLSRHFAENGGGRAAATFHNISDLAATVRQLPGNKTVAMSLASTSESVAAAFSAASFEIVDSASPVGNFKAVKNSVEQRAYTDCSLLDSAALVAFLDELDERMLAGETVTELSAAERLRQFRSTIPDFRGLSFETIAAAGPNAAVVHYRPSAATDRRLTLDEAFLLDSGGQYLGCTTDVTRTMYFGPRPPREVQEAYTRVLGGVIDLFNLTWPQRVPTVRIDAFARHRLWEAGLDYGHGTGHGIGLFLGVHEGPNGIGRQVALQEGNFQSIEPGFYRPETPQRRGFGIRLETITGVRPAGVSADFLQFAPVTWVPFEPKLIVLPMLTDSQLAWLNSYHRQCREKLQQALADIGQQRAMRWVLPRTVPLQRQPAAPLAASCATVAAACLLCLRLWTVGY